MKRVLVLFMLLWAALPAFAQSNAQITSFTTSYSFVSRAELLNRTARVPVSWTTANRPIGSNLVFEQVLPGGSAINVELPRTIPWVSSNGDGVAAPVLPTTDATEIVLRVRLVNVFDGAQYASRVITLPVRDDGGGDDGGTEPRITRFSADNRVLSRQALINGTERVRVAWESVNRPVTATLVFEQVFANGTVANIELPRDNPWVNPSDSGVVAPFSNDPNVSSVTLRVRMTDIVSGFTYDQRTVTLSAVGDVNTGNVQITSFTTGVSTIQREGLRRSPTITVGWNVANRPDNTNLAFEQVFSNNTAANVELPRDFEIIPSSGSGFVQLRPVADTENAIVLRLRVFNLQTGQTLAEQRLTLQIIDSDDAPDIIEVSGDACYQAPFPPGFGVEPGDTVEATSVIDLRDTSGTGGDVVASGVNGERFAVVGGPYCYRSATTDALAVRQWQLRKSTGAVGWTAEYTGALASYNRLLLPVTDGGGDDGGDDDDDTPTAISSFSVSPNPAPRFSTVTVSWDVSGGTTQIDIGWYPSQLWLGDTYREQLYSGNSTSGSVQVELDSMQVNDVRFVIDVYNGELTATQDATLDLTCAAQLAFNDPANSGECALPEVQVNAAYQTFENGFMVWRDDRDWIIVAYNDGTYRVYNDQWNGQAYTIEEAPGGLIAPERGFGYLWVNNPDLRERLGWATGDEISFTMKTQQLDKRGRRGEIEGEWYYALPDGRDIRTGYATTGSWQALS